MLDTPVYLKIMIVGDNVWVDRLKSVKDPLIVECLCVIRKYKVLRKAAQGCRYVSWDSVCDLCSAGPKYKECFVVFRQMLA